MATIKQIKEWIPKAVEIFNAYLPLESIDTIPEIHIANEKNLISKRNELLALLDSETRSVSRDEYDSAMELICGKKGYAILIQQKAVPTLNQDPRADYFFYRFLWHELGHYYAIIAETTDLHRFNNPGLRTDTHSNRAKQEGYWFWSEFIAEAISNHVDVNWRMNREDAVYRPDLIEWKPQYWTQITDKLVDYLDTTFGYYGAIIDEYTLAIYFAYLLKNDFCQLFLKAYDNCELYVDNWPFAPKKIEPGDTGDIDPTGIISQPETYHSTLWEMKEMLEKQLNKKEFWIIDEDWLETIGDKILTLTNKKVALLSGASEEDAEAALNISDEEKAQREKALREAMGDEQFEAMLQWAKKNGR